MKKMTLSMKNSPQTVIVSLKCSLKRYYLQHTHIQLATTLDTAARQRQKYSEGNFEIDN